MLKRIVGYLFLAIGIIGYIYFSEYHGDLIRNTWIWNAAGFSLVIIGLLLLWLSRRERNARVTAQVISMEHSLQRTGERILVNIENCTFKSNNYEEEIVHDELHDGQSWNTLVGSDSNYETEEVNQTVIIFTNTSRNPPEIFKSQVFPMDEITMQFHVINKDVNLYVDRKNRNNYFFDLVRKE